MRKFLKRGLAVVLATVVVVGNRFGDIDVLRQYVVSAEETDTEESDVTGKSCSYCDGDGKCNECGGTSWVWVTEFVFNDDGFPVLETNNKFCGAIYCNGGSCSKCGGDGVR